MLEALKSFHYYFRRHPETESPITVARKFQTLDLALKVRDSIGAKLDNDLKLIDLINWRGKGITVLWETVTEGEKQVSRFPNPPDEWITEMEELEPDQLSAVGQAVWDLHSSGFQTVGEVRSNIRTGAYSDRPLTEVGENTALFLNTSFSAALS